MRTTAAALLASAVLARAALAAGGGTNEDLGPVVSLVNQAPATVYSADLSNPSAHAAKCDIDLTSVGGTVTVTIYGKDGASGSYYSMLASPAINSAGSTVLTVGPGLTAATNSVASDYLPPTWRVGVVVATGSATGTVGCSVIE